MSIKSVLKLALAFAMAGAVHAEEATEQQANDLSRTLDISYGKCYHIVSRDNNHEYLGHNKPTPLHILQMGSRADVVPFKVCKGPGHCTLNQPNSRVQAGEEFYLYDTVGSYWAPNGGTVVANNGGWLYPETASNRQYVVFSAYNECMGGTYPCPVRLHARDTYPWADNGVFINNADWKNLWMNKGGSSLFLTFEEVPCHRM